MGKSKDIQYVTNEKECHLVISHALTKKGYVKIKRDGEVQELHRYVYKQSYGDIPEGLVVRHKCDNRNCINI